MRSADASGKSTTGQIKDILSFLAQLKKVEGASIDEEREAIQEPESLAIPENNMEYVTMKHIQCIDSS